MSLLRGAFLAVIRAYRTWVGPYLAPACRFYPTCSAYAMEAVELHGVFRGAWYGALRICRCHPWATGGVDTVPRKHSVGDAR